MNLRHALLVLGFALGMLVMEILLEKLFSLPDIPHTIAIWNTTTQFLFCAMLPVIVGAVQRRGPSPEQSLPDLEKASETNTKSRRSAIVASVLVQLQPYLCLSALQFMSSVAANHAVLYVDFSVKVVFKASKLIPTMALSTLMGNGRVFGALEYAAALMICGGTVLFAHGSAKGSEMGEASNNLAIGAGLLAFAVLAEGVVPNVQQMLMRGGINPNTLMSRTNMFGFVGGMITLAVYCDINLVFQYMYQNPTALWCLVSANFTFSICVMCYTRLVQEMGSVFAVGVSTARKSITVMLSFLLFPNKHIDTVRMLGFGTVAGGVVLADLVARRAK